MTKDLSAGTCKMSSQLPELGIWSNVLCCAYFCMISFFVSSTPFPVFPSISDTESKGTYRVFAYMCISVSVYLYFKRDFLLQSGLLLKVCIGSPRQILQMAAYLKCLTSPHACFLFLLSLVANCSRLSLSNCLC